MLSSGLPAISSPTARVLILGLRPTRISIEHGEYYADPTDAFWTIVSPHHWGFPSEYADRTAFLVDHTLALWDVFAAEAVPNNFRPFFDTHPKIRRIFFNGSQAAILYRRHVLPTLSEKQRWIPWYALPSTSAAHAKLTPAEKSRKWSFIWDTLGWRSRFCGP